MVVVVVVWQVTEIESVRGVLVMDAVGAILSAERLSKGGPELGAGAGDAAHGGRHHIFSSSSSSTPPFQQPAPCRASCMPLPLLFHTLNLPSTAP